jgi:phosphopantetheinyl transferase (holo-ACP synthase)
MNVDYQSKIQASGNKSCDRKVLPKECSMFLRPDHIPESSKAPLAPNRTSTEFSKINNNVIFASCLWDKLQTAADARRQAKNMLIALLLKGGSHRRPWFDGALKKQNASRHPPFIVSSNRLGQPLLLINGCRGPSLSFAHIPGRTWAAMSLCKDGVGIDVASSMDFFDGYPLRRIFHRDEFQATMKLFERYENAAAALWSVKEAVVKSLGCGYRFFAPIDLKVRIDFDFSGEDKIYVVLSDYARHRIGLAKEKVHRVHLIRRGTLFLSVALAVPQKTCKSAL